MATVYEIRGPATSPVTFIGAFTKIPITVTKRVDGIVTNLKLNETLLFPAGQAVASDIAEYEIPQLNGQTPVPLNVYVHATSSTGTNFFVNIKNADANSTGFSASIPVSNPISVNIVNTSPVIPPSGAIPTVLEASDTNPIIYKFVVTNKIGGTPIAGAFIGLKALSADESTNVYRSTILSNPVGTNVDLVNLNLQTTGVYIATDGTGNAQLNILPQLKKTTWGDLFYIIDDSAIDLRRTAVYDKSTRRSTLLLPLINTPADGLLNLDSFAGDNVTLTVPSSAEFSKSNGAYYSLNDIIYKVEKTIRLGNNLSITIPKSRFKTGPANAPVTNSIFYINLTTLALVGSSVSRQLFVTGDNGGGGGDTPNPQGQLALPYIEGQPDNIQISQLFIEPTVVICPFLFSAPFIVGADVTFTTFINAFKMNDGSPTKVVGPVDYKITLADTTRVSPANSIPSSFIIRPDPSLYNNITALGPNGERGNVVFQWSLKGTSDSNQVSRPNTYRLFD